MKGMISLYKKEKKLASLILQKNNQKALNILGKIEFLDFKDELQNSFIHMAVLADNIEIIPFLLERNIDINQVNSSGYNPLILAVVFNKKELAKAIISNLKNNLTDFFCKKTIAQLAFKKDNYILKLFIEKLDNLNLLTQNILQESSFSELSLDLLTFLKDKKLDFNFLNNFNETLLFKAIKFWKHQEFDFLIHNNFDINFHQDKQCYIENSIVFNNIHSFSFFIKKLSENLYKLKKDHFDLLSSCIRYSRKEMLEIYLKIFPDKINITKNYKNLLFVSLNNDNLDTILDILLKFNIDINFKNKENEEHLTILYHVGLTGQLTLIEKLIKHNADYLKVSKSYSLMDIISSTIKDQVEQIIKKQENLKNLELI